MIRVVTGFKIFARDYRSELVLDLRTYLRYKLYHIIFGHSIIYGNYVAYDDFGFVINIKCDLKCFITILMGVRDEFSCLKLALNQILS